MAQARSASTGVPSGKPEEPAPKFERSVFLDDELLLLDAPVRARPSRRRRRLAVRMRPTSGLERTHCPRGRGDAAVVLLVARRIDLDDPPVSPTRAHRGRPYLTFPYASTAARRDGVSMAPLHASPAEGEFVGICIRPLKATSRPLARSSQVNAHPSRRGGPRGRAMGRPCPLPDRAGAPLRCPRGTVRMRRERACDGDPRAAPGRDSAGARAETGKLESWNPERAPRAAGSQISEDFSRQPCCGS